MIFWTHIYNNYLQNIQMTIIKNAEPKSALGFLKSYCIFVIK
jgi:hypothetical protein